MRRAWCTSGPRRPVVARARGSLSPPPTFSGRPFLPPARGPHDAIANRIGPQPPPAARVLRRARGRSVLLRSSSSADQVSSGRARKPEPGGGVRRPVARDFRWEGGTGKYGQRTRTDGRPSPRDPGRERGRPLDWSAPPLFVETTAVTCVESVGVPRSRSFRKCRKPFWNSFQSRIDTFLDTQTSGRGSGHTHHQHRRLYTLYKR